MTAKPQLRAESRVAADGVTFAPPDPRPAPETQGRGNFFSMVSEALARDPGKSGAAVKHTKGAPKAFTNQTAPLETAKAQKNNNSSVVGSKADESQSGDADTTGAGAQNPGDEPAKSASEVDATVSSMAMALLSQPLIAPKDQSVPGVPLIGESAVDSDLTDDSKCPAARTGEVIAKPAGDSGPIEGKVAVPPGGKPTVPGKAAPEDLNASPPPTPGDKRESNLPPLKSTGSDRPIAPPKGPEPPVSTDGISAALNNQRMKSVNEKIEIAGRTLQKLPYVSPGNDISADLTDKMDSKSNGGNGGTKQEFSAPTPMMDFATKVIALPVEQGGGLNDVSKLDTQAQVDRIGRLVSQEVISIRQSGANVLAVSLKVDQHTELFLQLTNHNGQIQASVRCERGNAAGLDSHWGQLQESLARQNVQLMPMEGKSSTNNSPFNSPSQNNSFSQFNQSSRNPQREAANLREELVAAGEVAGPAGPRNAKTKTSSPQG